MSENQNTPINWSEIEDQLPGSFQQASNNVKTKPIGNPWIKAGLKSIAKVAPSIYTSATGGQYLKVVGPPEAINGTLAHMTDQNGHLLGGLTDSSGKLQAQTRFESIEGGLSAATSAAAVFQVLSVVTAQYYLHEISTSLKKVESKVDEVKDKIDSGKIGKIRQAYSVIDQLYNSNITTIESTGGLPGKTEFWARMGHAENNLGSEVFSFEEEIMMRIHKLSSNVSKNGKRIKESYDEHIDLLNDLKEFQNSRTVSYYLLAVRGMIQWFQLTLAYDSQTLGGMKDGRYEAMVKFVRGRQAFFANLIREYNFILKRPEGKNWKDKLDPDPSPVINWVVKKVLPVDHEHDIDFFSFENRREAILSDLVSKRSLLPNAVKQFRQLTQSLNSPDSFYLEANAETEELVLNKEALYA